MSAVAAASSGAGRTRRFSAALMICALALGVVAGILFLAFPQIDLMASRLFYSGDGTFAGQSATWVGVLRSVFKVLFWLCVAGTVAGGCLTRYRKRVWLRLTFAHWLFLGVCLAMGPGVIANVVLKDQWGRARPKQIVEFGGSHTFTPPLVRSNQCRRN